MDIDLLFGRGSGQDAGNRTRGKDLNIKDLFDNELLKAHILNRVVSETRHPEHKNLAIYNYTHIAQHENVWDNVSEQCRGLIIDTDTGDVLARPFRKFYNLNTSFKPETLEANLPSWKPRVLEKLDGSLGILYKYNGVEQIATRGSFASDQAIWASQWYIEHMMSKSEPYGIYTHFKQYEWPYDYTPLFEIIYKENRIVVSYEYEGLVLLGLVNNSTGFELSPHEVSTWASKNGLRVPQEFIYSLDECKADKSPNTEGFVLQYWNSKAPIPLRLKIKTDDYVRLHKVITGLNPKGIWEHLSLGLNPELLWSPATANRLFCDWCIEWINTFQRMYDKLEQDAITAFGKATIRSQREVAAGKGLLDSRAMRKCFAMAAQEEASNLLSALFAMHDGKCYQPALWKLLEPKITGKEVFIRDADQFNGI